MIDLRDSLYRGKKSESRHHPLLALDTENNPETGEFICAALYGVRKDHHGKYHVIDEFFTDKNKLQNWLINAKKLEKKRASPFILVGYHIAYDLFYIEEIINDNTRIETSMNFITAKLRNGIRIKDLKNFSDHRFKLEDWMEFLHMEKEGIYKVKTVCPNCGEKTAEFKNCPMCRASLNWSKEEIELRCKMDAKATYFLGHKLEEFFKNECDTPMSNTVASSALNIWQYHFSGRIVFKRTEKQESINKFEREAYYGGRSETFLRGKVTVNKFDVNSMYLSILLNEQFPNPSFVDWYFDDKEFEQHFNSDQFMIINATVFVPQQHIPPLPFRFPNTTKLIFPTGEFKGTWCSPELKEAIKYGTKILRVHSYTVYTQSGNYFKEFAEFVYKQRKKYKDEGNLGYELMIKLIGNSFYGKFGQRNGIKANWIKMKDFPGDIEGLEYRKIGNIEYIYVGEDKEKIDSMHTFPVIPAFVTAYARIKLLKELKKCDKEVVYCDTDSIHLLAHPCKDFGYEGIILTPWEYEIPNIGEFKWEGRVTDEYFRPKHYGNKLKGVPKRARKLSENDTEIVYEYEKPYKRNEAIRNQKIQNQWHTVRKIVSKNDDKRKWKDNISDPLNTQELEKKERWKKEEKELKQEIRDVQEGIKEERKLIRKVKQTDLLDIDKTLEKDEIEQSIKDEMLRYLKEESYALSS
jgi:hypothetical protein